MLTIKQTVNIPQAVDLNLETPCAYVVKERFLPDKILLISDEKTISVSVGSYAFITPTKQMLSDIAKAVSSGEKVDYEDAVDQLNKTLELIKEAAWAEVPA